MSRIAAPAVAIEAFPATPQLTVETISDFQSFLGLRELWDRVHEEACLDNPFLTHEWVRTWWEAFGRGKELHVLLLRCGADPVAIVPLMFNKARMLGFNVRRLESICNSHSPRFDFLVARYPGDVYRAIWRHVLAQQSRWDVLQLSQLPQGSLTLEEIPKLAALDGYLHGVWRSTESPYLSLLGGWETYFEHLSSKHRANLRNRLRKLSQVGRVDHHSIASGPKLQESLEEGFRIEAAAWKGKAGTAICCQPQTRQFYTALADRFSQRDWFRLLFLTVGTRRIAVAYSICFKKNLFLLKIGYDPEFSSCSPFNLLCQFSLQDAFKEGLSEVDFLGDSTRWKLDWAHGLRPHYWVYVFAHALRSRLLHSAKFRLIPALRQKPMLPSFLSFLGCLEGELPRGAAT